MAKILGKDDILQAYRTIKGDVRQTPLQKDDFLSEKYQANIYLKREDLQVVRSFKLRGAYYAIHQLSEEELAKGVICASAGNHAQGVAYTCHLMEVNCVIFMPNTTPNQKIDQVRYFGGEHVEIIIEGDSFDESNAAAHAYAEEHQLSFVEPFNDKNVMAGQGTLAVEVQQALVAEGEQADYFFTQIGGGGLIGGVGAYTSEMMPETKLIGVEPEGAASMSEAFLKGEPVQLPKIDKFADGTAVAKVGDLTYQQAREVVDDITIVPEGRIARTILTLYSKQAIVAEPSGALSVAALDNYRKEIKGKTVVCLISGGNNDINRMNEIEERALIFEGIKHYFVVNFPQRAGALKEFVTDILSPDDDVTRFEYTKKNSRNEGPVLVGIELGKKENIGPLLERLEEFDPNFIDVSKNKTLFEFLI